MSLPTRERGLKLAGLACLWIAFLVAPYTGAWIETSITDVSAIVHCVAPYTGAWIETCRSGLRVSLPERRSLHGSVD